MIKFFRKIRQRLLSESKFSKYLLYAIGEIVLVVIGILIALQINNWKETSKQHRTEKEFLASVKNDLKQDKAFMELVADFIEPKILAYAELNEDLIILYRTDRNALDSIFNAYFNTQRTFYPISGTYEAAVAGNQLIAFQNKELVQKITRIYNSTYDRLVDNGQILDERWAFVSKKYSHERRTGHFRDRSPEQLNEFLDDLHHHYMQLDWYLDQLESTIVEIDEIIEE